MAMMKSMSMLSSTEIVICGGARTPFGGFMGSLSSKSATELATHAAKATLSKLDLDPQDIDQIIMGNVMQTSLDAPYLARHVGLYAGMKESSTALTINRLCGSGIESILQAASQILLGQAVMVLAGGAESMSQAPYTLPRLRSGYRLGPDSIMDTLQGGLTDAYNGLPMGITAENLAKQYDISREASDAFSLSSQQKYNHAWEKGVFEEEIAPMEIHIKKQTTTLAKDEHPRPQTTKEGLAKLKPVFDANGVVTAGSSSGIVDGAACVLVTTKHEATRRGLPILGRLISHGIAGCRPDIMGIGPVPASQKALLSIGKTFKDMSIVEINEAFAPQVLSVMRELGLKEQNVNVNGGAIAVGHPLAASGTRIVLHALLELQRRDAQFALTTACIGGGQGIALVLERIST